MVVDPKMNVLLQVSLEPIVIAGTEQVGAAKEALEKIPVMPKASVGTKISF
jgi:hypothetical protein